jgi:hypothetical protein
VQVQPVDAPDFERNVVTDNVGDVGRHRNLLAEIPAMVLLRETPMLASVPTSRCG